MEARQAWRERLVFTAEAMRDGRRVGAVAPSGRRLVSLLAEPVARRPGARVLEVGAGTGAVTRALASLLGPAGRLDVVEANARFAAGLERDVAAPGRVTVHACRVQELPAWAGAGGPEGPEEPVAGAADANGYDVIVSGLPFRNFDPHTVTEIMDGYLRLLRPGGELTYFAYLGAGSAHRAVDAVLNGYHRAHAIARWTAWSNLPPAAVWLLRPAAAAAVRA